MLIFYTNLLQQQGKLCKINFNENVKRTFKTFSLVHSSWQLLFIIFDNNFPSLLSARTLRRYRKFSVDLEVKMLTKLKNLQFIIRVKATFPSKLIS